MKYMQMGSPMSGAVWRFIGIIPYWALSSLVSTNHDLYLNQSELLALYLRKP